MESFYIHMHQFSGNRVYELDEVNKTHEILRLSPGISETMILIFKIIVSLIRNLKNTYYERIIF